MEQNKIFLTKNEIYDKQTKILIKYNSDKNNILPLMSIRARNDRHQKRGFSYVKPPSSRSA